jgi:sialate O-acetylesterase
MADFSAVAYFFAKKVHTQTGVPIGLIDASWGASSAEVWTPKQVFENNTDLKESAKLITANPWVANQPSLLYNAMIAPLGQFKIAGTLWYQGESNTANYGTYTDLFSEMIGSWRAQWGYDFPFYFVQIAPFKYGRKYEGAEIRNAQRKTLELAKTGMVVVSDIGNIEDIHPQNKKDVGERLANLALKNQYGAELVLVNGSLYKSVHFEGRKAIVLFDHAEGLHTKGVKRPVLFELADANGEFFPAKAKIMGNSVELSSKMVKKPTKVRYAWSNTAEPHLFNAANLPTSCFITE